MFAPQLNFQQVWEESKYPSNRAGTIGRTADQRLWRYCQADDALSQGNVTRKISNHGIVINADVDAAAAADLIRVTGTGDFTVTALEDADYETSNVTGAGHQYFLWIDAGATQGQGGIITFRASNNAVDVYWLQSNDGKISTALTTSSDYVVTCDYRVELTTDPDDNTVCIPQIDVTDEYWFWGLYFGKGVVLIDTDDTAISDDDIGVIPAATTDGYCGALTATSTAAEALATFGRAYVDQTADGLILFNANCMWTDPSTNILLPTDVTLQYPRTFRQ